MAKAAKEKIIKPKAKAKERPHLDEADLEREYIIERFFDVGPIFSNFDVAFMGLQVFLFYIFPHARYASSIGFIYWFSHFMLCKYVSRYRYTEHKEYGKKLFEIAATSLFVIHEALQVSSDSFTSEEARNAHAAMVTLTVYFLAFLLVRMASPRDHSGIFLCVIYPLIVLKYPRFGIFSPRYEALAYSVAMGLGWLIGSIIDEMRWRHFLLIHGKEQELEQKSKELSRESRKREMAMEVLLSYNDKSSFFEIRK